MRPKPLVLIVLFAILGCVFYFSRPKEVSRIDSLVAWVTESDKESFWMNGMVPAIHLSREATSEEVLRAYRIASHANRQYEPIDAQYEIVATKKVILAGKEMTAIEFTYDGIRRILITRFEDERTGWWTKLF